MTKLWLGRVNNLPEITWLESDGQDSHPGLTCQTPESCPDICPPEWDSLPASPTLQYTLTPYSLPQSKSTPAAKECLELACFIVMIKPHSKKENDTVPLGKFSAKKPTASYFLVPFHWMRK